MPLVKECAKYFKSNKAYNRIMNELLAKYKSFGEPRGMVILNDATKEECAVANGIIEPKRAFYPPTLKFRAADFEKGLAHTKFSGVSLKCVLEEYYGEVIVSNGEKRRNKEQLISNFFEDFLKKYDNVFCYKWLSALVLQKNFGYQTVLNAMSISNDNAKTMLENVCNAINSRQEGELVKIAVLSANITGDSHYFDSANPAGKLLIKGLSYLCDIAQTGEAETIKEIYAEFGIEPDNISGSTASIGIRLYDVDNNEHPAFKAFADNGESCLIATANLANICNADTDKKTVFVVENQMVFSALCPVASENRLGLICTSGQMKCSGIRLITMLVNADCKILYAGDFDPEGLQIADRLLRRFPDKNVHTWRMTADDYKSIDKAEVVLSDMRLTKLNSIKSKELVEIANILIESEKAAYQELLIPQMKSDMELLAKQWHCKLSI